MDIQTPTTTMSASTANTTASAPEETPVTTSQTTAAVASTAVGEMGPDNSGNSVETDLYNSQRIHRGQG